MDSITTSIATAAATVDLWRAAARVAPTKTEEAAIRRRIREAEVLLSIARKHFYAASRAAADLNDWLADQDTAQVAVVTGRGAANAR